VHPPIQGSHSLLGKSPNILVKVVLDVLSLSAKINNFLYSISFEDRLSFIRDVSQNFEHILNLSQSSCTLQPLDEFMLHLMRLVFLIFVANCLEEVTHLLADHLLPSYVAQIFESHEEGELVDVTFKPDIVDLFWKFLLVSINVPATECFLDAHGLFLLLVKTQKILGFNPIADVGSTQLNLQIVGFHEVERTLNAC
jgi:hypothetical protein